MIGLPSCAELRLAIGPDPRHAHFDEAHAAIARRAELRVIAIVRDELAGLLAGLDHPRALGKLMPDAVDLDVE